jgi:hypothetical protein
MEKKFEPSVKKQYKQGSEENAPKQPMNKEETIAFYNENLPFMKLQDEYEELVYRFYERKIRNLEAQVRELEAIGYLAQWKAGQDDAKNRQETELKMKEDWEKMTPEEQAEWTKKAQQNIQDLEKQAQGAAAAAGKI